MKKIKTVLLILLCISTIMLLYLNDLKEKQNMPVKKLTQEEEKIVKTIMEEYKKNTDLEREKLITPKEIASAINNARLKEELDNLELDGCFEIKDYEMSYNVTACDKIITDASISNNPVLLSSFIPVKYTEGKFTKTNLINWYNYNEKNFAYAITLKQDISYNDNEVINEENINNIFIWIPSFYYNESINKFSYYKMPNSNKNNHFEFTTYEYVPFAFFHKNRYVHGIWVQLDNNKLSEEIKNRTDVDIHNTTENELYVINLFQKYHNVQILDNINENNYIITMGKGAFFNG